MVTDRLQMVTDFQKIVIKIQINAGYTFVTGCVTE